MTHGDSLRTFIVFIVLFSVFLPSGGHSVCAIIENRPYGILLINISASFYPEVLVWQFDATIIGFESVYIINSIPNATVSAIPQTTNGFSFKFGSAVGPVQATITAQGRLGSTGSIVSNAFVDENGMQTKVYCQSGWGVLPGSTATTNITPRIAQIFYSDSVGKGYTTNSTATTLLVDDSLETCFNFLGRTSLASRTSIKVTLTSLASQNILINITGNKAFDCKKGVVYAKDNATCMNSTYRECMLYNESQVITSFLVNGIGMLYPLPVCQFICPCVFNCTEAYIEYLAIDIGPIYQPSVCKIVI